MFIFSPGPPSITVGKPGTGEILIHYPIEPRGKIQSYLLQVHGQCMSDSNCKGPCQDQDIFSGKEWGWDSDPIDVPGPIRAWDPYTSYTFDASEMVVKGEISNHVLLV